MDKSTSWTKLEMQLRGKNETSFNFVWILSDDATYYLMDILDA